jgi:hypothetical protein
MARASFGPPKTSPSTFFSLRHPEMVGQDQAVREKVSGPDNALAQVTLSLRT